MTPFDNDDTYYKEFLIIMLNRCLEHIKQNGWVCINISIDLFKRQAKTTTIPAQLAKKYACKIVPVYIERLKNFHFKLSFKKPIKFDNDTSIEQISLELNNILEKMILKNPDQWIWSHDRWK